MEYAKYTPTPQTSNIVDFSGLTTDLAKTISGIQKSRDTARAELEAAADVATKNAENPTLTSNRNFNDVLLNYSQDGVSQIASWKKQLMNGEITPNEYKSKINSIQESTSSLANIAKNWDAKNLEFIKRQTDGTASGIEMDIATLYNGLGDVANSQLFTDNQGKVFHRNTKTGKVMSISALTNVQSTVYNRTDVQGKNKQFADALGKRINWTDQGREGWISIEDVWNSPDNKLAREYHASSILSDPKATASTLNDAGGIQMVPYTSPEEYDSKLSDLISKTKATFDSAGVPFTSEKEAELKLSMMKMVNDESGNMVPELTKEQNDKARDIVLQNLRAQMDREIKGGAKQVFAPTAPKTGADAGGYKQKEIDEATEVYKLSKNAMIESKVGDSSNTNEYLAAIGQKMKKYVVKKKFSDGTFGLMIYDYVKSTDQYGNPVYTKAIDTKSGKPIRQGKSLAEYITGKSAGEANTIWELGKDNTIETTAVGKEGRTPYNPESKNTKTTAAKSESKTSEKFNAGREANIKATMKANPGASRADVLKALGY